MSNESSYFSHYNPKFQIQIHYTLEGTVKNVQVIGIPILIFLLEVGYTKGMFQGA